VAVVDDEEEEEDLDPVRVWVFRVGCCDHPPRLPKFFVLIEYSNFSAKGKGYVFSPEGGLVEEVLEA